MSDDHVKLAKQATDQIRDALCSLLYVDSGFHEDEATVALDALDWLEDHLGLNLIADPSSGAGLR